MCWPFLFDPRYSRYLQIATLCLPNSARVVLLDFVLFDRQDTEISDLDRGSHGSFMYATYTGRVADEGDADQVCTLYRSENI
jgi:hypothetical protein